MNKKTLILTSVILFITFNLHAQLLWKISGNGLTQPSYLFGTHHFIDKEQIKNFDTALSICKNADVVVGEIPLTDASASQTKVMQAAIMTNITCKDLMNAKDYALVDSVFKNLIGVGLDQLGAMKPMMLYTMYMAFEYFGANNIMNKPEAIDEIFQKAGIENNKKVMGLETMDEQLGFLLDSIPLKRQAEILVKDIKEKDDMIEAKDELNDLYLAGELEAAEKLDKEETSMLPKEKDILIYNRNKDWMKKIPELIKNQSCFIAVGFLHLAGETGLINRLKKEGYKVEPIEL